MSASLQSFPARLERDTRAALMTYFLRRVRDRSEAEDLTQEVFVRLAGSPTHCDEAGYIFTIAANLLKDRARRNAVRNGYAAAISTDADRHCDTLDPHRIAEGREAVSVLITALQSLPERTRTIFLLFRYEHMSQAEIARALEISISTVEKTVRRAYRHLNAQLEIRP